MQNYHSNAFQSKQIASATTYDMMTMKLPTQMQHIDKTLLCLIAVAWRRWSFLHQPSDEHWKCVTHFSGFPFTTEKEKEKIYVCACTPFNMCYRKEPTVWAVKVLHFSFSVSYTVQCRTRRRCDDGPFPRLGRSLISHSTSRPFHDLFVHYYIDLQKIFRSSVL